MSGLRAQKNHKNIPAKPLIVGVICGTLCCIVLLFLTAFMVTKSEIMPNNLIKPLILVLTGLGTFVGGYVSGKISRENGMLYGIACGFVMFILFFLGGFVVARNSVTMLTVLRLLTMILSGAMGGIMGVNKV